MPTNGMTINGLNPLSALTADDKIPVWDTGASGEPTKEITAQNMANSVKSLASLPNTTEMEAAIQALTPGLVTTSQRGLYAPDDCIDQGKIALATESVKGLLGPGDKARLNSPDRFIYDALAAFNNPGFHNAIPRRKNLGNSFTAAQIAAIQGRTYEGLFVGDYWQKDGITHTIAHIEPNYRCGENISLGGHIMVISDGGWSSKWNETNDTSTGYVGSKVREYIKSSGGPQDKIIGFFGSSHVLSYRAIYPSTYSSGKATDWDWVDARSELPNETQVYGHQVWTGGDNGIGNGYEDGIDKFQLAVFRHFPELINTRADWWLRSVNSATAAALVAATGRAYYHSASSSFGVRPLSLIA